jgi:3'(2'), 5'-bisphosphate nucleotidase
MWALDPIDGTKGFLRGGQYAVCLALLVDGKVQVGAMGCPNLPLDPKDGLPKEGDAQSMDRKDLGAIFVAVKGQGARQVSARKALCGHTFADAYLSQRPMSSDKEEPIQMRALNADSLNTASFCESVEAGHSSHGTNKRIAELLNISAPSVRMDSQAKYASVARGDGDVYLRLPVGDGSYQEKIWVRRREARQCPLSSLTEHARTTPRATCSCTRPAASSRTAAAVTLTLARAARSGTTAASLPRRRTCTPR